MISKFSVNGNRSSIMPEVWADESNNGAICNWIECRQYPYIMSLNSIFVYNISYINKWIICSINSYNISVNNMKKFDIAHEIFG